MFVIVVLFIFIIFLSIPFSLGLHKCILCDAVLSPVKIQTLDQAPTETYQTCGSGGFLFRFAFDLKGRRISDTRKRNLEYAELKQRENVIRAD